MQVGMLLQSQYQNTSVAKHFNDSKWAEGFGGITEIFYSKVVVMVTQLYKYTNNHKM